MQANLNPEELDKFADLAATWWDERGPCRPLHDLNPCRLDYLRARMELSGAAIADVGCGGGIFSEALARKGARVTGIDATRELIDVAREHALESAIEIDYRLGTSSELAASDAARFDAVVCMELIEHVPDPDALLKDCARMVKPNGLLVVSTLNRTPEAYALGIFIASSRNPRLREFHQAVRTRAQRAAVWARARRRERHGLQPAYPARPSAPFTGRQLFCELQAHRRMTD